GATHHALGVLAQIDREIEALGHEALAQCCPILRGQFNFAERRAGMEEIELDRLRDTGLHRPDGFRGPRGQDGDPRFGEMPLQTPYRRERDEAIADVVELDDQDLADIIAIERWP